jgi:hypothetical protein
MAIAKAQTMIFKTLHRQLYLENHELQEKPEVDSGAHKKLTHDPSCDYSLQAQHNDDGLNAIEQMIL